MTYNTATYDTMSANVNRQSWRSVLYALIGGLVLPILAWILDIYLKEISFSISSWIIIHKNNPIHIIIDIAPIIIVFIVYIYQKINTDNTVELSSKIEERNSIIEKNANLAKEIGKGNLELDFQIEKEDKLGQALLLMRNNLVESSRKEREQNWIARGKEEISNVLRRHNNIDILAYHTLVKLIEYIGAIQGAFYIFDEEKNILRNIASYAYNRKKYINQEFKIGQGLVGQAAYEKDIIYRKEIPEDYITITSGILGDKKPSSILVMPLISDRKLQGVIEFASLEDEITELSIKFVKELSEIIGQTVFNLKVNTRTEKLLKDAQELTEELQENQEELRKNAIEMKLTQEELERTNKNLEKQIAEVENAQNRLYSLLENASEVISIYDEKGMVKYESPSVKTILGYNPDNVIGTDAFETIHYDENDPTRQVFEELLRNPDEPQTFEFQYKKNEDEILWLETIGRNFLNNSAIQGIIFNTRDITVRKIAEQAQKMSGQMQALSENSPDIIIRLNLEGQFFYANPMFERFTGIKVKEIVTKTINEVELKPEIQNLFTEILSKLSNSKEKFEQETDFPTLDEQKIMQVNVIPELGDSGQLETVLIVAHDITERKRIEEVIREKNRSINDSINYAKRIQTAILPDNKALREALPNSFIFYKPRDVVSGDFPWFFKKEDDIYVAAVDCTGHGVPGAMLAFVGYFLLNNIVDHDVEQTAADILDQLHSEVRRTLRQDRDDAEARDGMDIAFCKIRSKTNELQYSGAHRPLYLLRGNELTQYDGNKKAIGGIPPRKKTEKPFINHLIKYEKGDKIFFFSDGLPDQIGGEEGKKYQPARIRENLVENYNYSMMKFSRFFIRDFNQWKQENKQIDDVLLIGIEF